MAFSLSVLFFLLLDLRVYSYNLLCDATIDWIEYPVSDTYKFNHTTCTLSVSASSNSNERRLIPVSSIFNNSSNYPLNFSIHGLAHNGNANAGINFGILNAGFWGYSEPFTNNIPMQLTYEWLTPDVTECNVYKDQIFNTTLPMSTNKASNIISIGVAVSTTELVANTGIVFDNVYLNATTANPTTNIPTTYSPTTGMPTTYSPTTYSPTTNTPTTNIPTTNIPTTNIPTNMATNNPTSKPFYCHGNGYVVIISFNYTLNSNDNTVDTDDNLVNMIQDIVNNKNKSLSDCYISKHAISIESNQYNKAIGNISLCTECDKHVIENDLFGQLIDDNNVILVVPDSIDIVVDVINNDNEAEHDQSTTEIVSISDQTTENAENVTFWIVVGVLLCIICIGVICIVVFVVRKLKKDIQHDKNNNKMLTMVTTESNAVNTVPKPNNGVVIGERELNNDIIHTNITPGNFDTDVIVNDDIIIGDDESPGNDNDDTGDNNSNNSTPSGGGNDDFDTQRFDESNTDKVKKWLVNIGFEKYCRNFIENGYDTFDIITCVTDVSELLDIGIASKQDQNEILNEIRKLKNVQEHETNGLKMTDEGNNEGNNGNDVCVVYG